MNVHTLVWLVRVSRAGTFVSALFYFKPPINFKTCSLNTFGCSTLTT